CCFFFSSRRRHTRWPRDWSSDVCSSDLILRAGMLIEGIGIAYDPNFNSLTTAIPIYKRIVDRALGPAGWPTVKDRIVKEGIALYTLLRDMEAFFGRAGRDQIRVRIHPADVD